MKKILVGILMLLALAFSVSANPVLYPIADQEVNETDTLNFGINTITVPDNGSSTFDFSPSLDWISVNRINNTAATVTLSPDYDDFGVYDVEFSVSDDDSTHTDNATITVNNVNRAPTINLPTSRTVVHDFPETLDLSSSSISSDPDGDTLYYSVTAYNASEVDCEVSGSTLTMTADTSFTGTASCTIEASDGDLTADDSISLKAEAQNPSVSIGDVDFGDVELNTTTTQKSFTIFNNGNLNLNNIDIVWDSAYDKYNLDFTSKPTTLNSGSVDTVYVIMDIPADVGSGSLSVPVIFTSDEVNRTFNLKADVLGRLQITDLDVKVDDKTDSNLDAKDEGYKIGEKAKPESHITFYVRVENAFPKDGPQIENILVTITIEEIDDSEDLEEESEEFDLDPDDTKKVTLEFDVPLKVDEESYNVIIEVEGEDEDGNEHKITKTLTLDVDKESHDLRIRRATLSPGTVQCSRTAELDVTVINIGSRDEDEVVLTVKSSALGIDLSQKDIELNEDPDDDDNEYEKTFDINIKDTVKAGTYTIEVRAYYDEDKLEDLERVTLQVKDCAPVTPPEEEEEEEEEVEVITPPEEEEEEVITPPVEEEEKQKFTETTEYILILVLINLIVVIVVVSLLVALLRK